MAKASWLAFQLGWMAWFGPGLIIASSDSDWWDTFSDQWDQQQVFTGDPPDGCLVPQRGLGDAWHRHGLVIRLGHALGHETAYAGEVKEVEDDLHVLDPWGAWRVLPGKPSETELPKLPELPELPAGMIFAWSPVLNVRLPSGKERNLSFYRGLDPIEGGGIRVHWVGYSVTLHPDRSVTLLGTTMEVFTGEDAKELRAYLDMLGINNLPLINGGPGE